MSPAPPEMKETSSRTPSQTMQGHTSHVFGVVHLPGGKRIITCSRDNSLRLWDLEHGVQIGSEWRDEEDGEGVVTMLALSPNGKTMASGSNNGTVRLWDVEIGKVIVKWKEHAKALTSVWWGRKWKGHTEAVMSVCWSPNGERVASGCFDGTARVWDVKSREPVQGLNPINTGHRYMYAVSYSPEAKMIATGGSYKQGIKIWDGKTGKRLSAIKHDHLSMYMCTSLAWTSDEKKLIAGSNDASIRIFDTATWQQIAVLEGHEDVVYSITLFQNDRLLASTSWDKTARLWNLDTNLQVGPPLQHENFVWCAAFSADGKLLSTACYDNNAYVWDIQTVLDTAGIEDLLGVSVNVLCTISLL
jgi:WD40 repeat protein